MKILIALGLLILWIVLTVLLTIYNIYAIPVTPFALVSFILLITIAWQLSARHARTTPKTSNNFRKNTFKKK